VYEVEGKIADFSFYFIHIISKEHIPSHENFGMVHKEESERSNL